jgi:four helix bundle protein
VRRDWQAASQSRASLKDQLDNAASSVVANIAEGAGEFSGKEKARFYRMARRSAVEIAAWVEIVVAMLVKLIQTCER